MKLSIHNIIHRKRGAPLGVAELIAIALGGMIGGGIFSILGISVSMIGVFTPLAIILGGLVAALAAYSYVKLGVYFKDEGATYSFFKRVFPDSSFAASLIGWWVIFGYISTLALYAHTFSSYAISGFEMIDIGWVRKLLAGGVITLFAVINILSVRGMGWVEDLMVYTKLIILAIISFVLMNNSKISIPVLIDENTDGFPLIGIFIISSITFVAYEGFQLVIHAVNEMKDPEKNIPRAIYAAIAIAITIYVIIAVGALLAIPMQDLIKDREYALAAGTKNTLGHLGKDLIITGALLATSSAISGTVFGASRLMAVIAKDGYFPSFLANRKQHIPVAAIITMSSLAFFLILIGGLRLILEFGSITFLVVSFLMAYANHKIRDKTKSSSILTSIALFFLFTATMFIFYYEMVHHFDQVIFIISLYALLTIGAWFYSRPNTIEN